MRIPSRVFFVAQHIINFNLDNYVSVATVGTYGCLTCFENTVICLDYVPVFFLFCLLRHNAEVCTRIPCCLRYKKSSWPRFPHLDTPAPETDEEGTRLGCAPTWVHFLASVVADGLLFIWRPVLGLLSVEPWVAAAAVFSLGCFPMGGWLLSLSTWSLTDSTCKTNSLLLLEILDTKHGNGDVVSLQQK